VRCRKRAYRMAALGPTALISAVSLRSAYALIATEQQTFQFVAQLVRAGRVDAYAAPRAVLLAMSHQLPGSRVLDDRFADIVYVAMVPKGKADRIAYVSAFIEEAKHSGLVQQTIDRYGLKGIQVAR
jgi:polar amino acid transport system substrate-binding protein